MKAIKKIIFILFLVIITLIVVFGWSYFSTPKQFVSNQTVVKNSDLFFSYEITKYPSNVEIIPAQYEKQKLKIGIVTDKWNLNFGIIPVSGRETRHLDISNHEKNDFRVNLNVYGNIKQMISFSKNDFILPPNKSISINIFLNTTEKTIPGNYTGEIDVIIKKPNSKSLSWIL
jgi:hypothetical protein